MAEQVKKSSAAAIALVWLVVVVPAGWGLTYTVRNALKIFTAAPAAKTAPVMPGVAAPAK